VEPAAPLGREEGEGGRDAATHGLFASREGLFQTLNVDQNVIVKLARKVRGIRCLGVRGKFYNQGKFQTPNELK
jgi:hypothetical protein